MKLKNRKLIRSVTSANLAFLFAVLLFLLIFAVPNNTLDYKINDVFYRIMLGSGSGPEISDRVVYLNITNDTYKYISRNYLDREFLAKINNILGELGPNSVMYDIVFRLPSESRKDSEFTESLQNAGMIFLPAGFKLSDDKSSFNWERGKYYDRLKDEFLGNPRTISDGEPFYALSGVVQLDDFAEAAYSSGHITTIPDADGIYRHYPLLIKIDEKYFPTVSLAMFLDYSRVPLDSLIIDWGNDITIPACEGSFIESDIRIPIDESGMAYIAFPTSWNNITNKVEAQKLIEYYNNEDYYDELLDKFEGNFVIIGDVAAGISDLGQTPLETDVPLVIIHASLLNAFLTQSFFDTMSAGTAILLILILGLLSFGLSILKTNKFLYIYGVVVFIALIIFAYTSVLAHTFVPLATIGITFFVIFFSQVTFLQVFGTREQAYIRDAFSKYVPKSVVEELIQNPESLHLGGEEKVVSVLFSDIQSFTSISEQLEARHLVSILNEYLTKMTGVILEQRGTVDKFIGDGIMAEFGAPLEYKHHEDSAVSAAILMQKELKTMNENYRKQGIYELVTRIGINTGKVIIGNMGSNQVFDYTAIGDTINLASRLEGANKKYGTNLMISEFTFQNLTIGKFLCRQLDYIRVKGKQQPVKVYEVYGFTEDDIPGYMNDYYKYYQEALEHFFNRKFKEAKSSFDAALTYYPDDKAACFFLNRIDEISPRNLPDSWDGAVTFFDK